MLEDREHMFLLIEERNTDFGVKKSLQVLN